MVDDDAPEEAFAPWIVWSRLGLDTVHADVVVLPRSAFEEDRDTPNTLAWPVSREGVLLFER